MTQKPYVVDELISAKAIAARVEALAKEISSHYSDTDKLVVVGLLRGSFIFIADLVRELDLPVDSKIAGRGFSPNLLKFGNPRLNDSDALALGYLVTGHVSKHPVAASLCKSCS